MRNLAQSIQIRDKTISQQMPPYIICEMAAAHEGKIDLAKVIIDGAATAEVDAIQLQIFNPNENVVPTSKLYTILQDLAFSPDEWHQIYEYAKQYQDMAISTFVYDVSSLELCLELGTDMVKLNSSDLLNEQMIARLGESNIPVTLGTGASTMMEISHALDLFTAAGGTQAILMHGVQNFPTNIDNAHIYRLRILQQAFDCLVGYADHTAADDPMSQIIDLVAVGMGANVIEKHMTHDRSKKGIDHQSALNPDEYSTFVQNIRQAARAYGSRQIKSFTESDVRYRQFQKKTIVAAQPLAKGSILTRDRVLFLRVEDEAPQFSPAQFSSIEGKTLINDVAAYAVISESDLAAKENNHDE